LIGKSKRASKTTAAALRAITGTLALDQQPVTISREFAYQALFSAWKVEYFVEMGNDYCEVAERFDLTCYKGKGNLKDIKGLNRPAVLKIKTLSGKLFYLTIIGINGRNVDVVIDGKVSSVTAKELDALWRRGEFIVLWRAPPGYRGAIRPGSRGPDVLWLSNQVSLIVGRDLSSDTKLKYSRSLVDDVKAFQSAQDITADGIAGSQTLIRLNSEVFEDVPLLVSDS